jgi:hypothetical protein
VALLEALARDTGGRVNPAALAAFDANLSSHGAVREIGLPLLWLALLLLPFDIALRRLLFARDQVAAALRRVGLGRLVRASSPKNQESLPVGSSVSAALPAAPSLQKAQKPAKAPKPAKPAPDLERLREAQERARRKARGEE